MSVEEVVEEGQFRERWIEAPACLTRRLLWMYVEMLERMSLGTNSSTSVFCQDIFMFVACPLDRDENPVWIVSFGRP